MAEYYEDDELLGLPPRQVVLAETVRQKPALATPTQGPDVKPQRAVTPSRQASYDAIKAYQARVSQAPDLSEFQNMARGIYEGAGPDMQTGMLLQALGGRLSPFGGQVFKQALEARSPQRMAGGTMAGGRFYEDPGRAQERELRGLETGARLAELQATHEESDIARADELERRRKEDLWKQEEFKLRRSDIAAQRGIAAANMQIARDRLNWEMESGKRDVVKDSEGNVLGIVNKATGVITPAQYGNQYGVVSGGTGPGQGPGEPGRPVQQPGPFGGGGGPAGIKLTDTQQRSFDAASKMQTGLGVFTELSGEGGALATPSATTIAALTTSHPAYRAALNKALDTNQQKYIHAASLILSGILRKESGAAITAEEWRTYGPAYLPWVGDTPETIQMKLDNINNMMGSYVMQSGPAGGRALRSGAAAAPPSGAPAAAPRSALPQTSLKKRAYGFMVD